MPTARAPTTAPALTLVLSAAPEAGEEAAEPELVADPFPEVEAPAFSSSTPLTPVAFLHAPASSNFAVLEKVISAHYTHFKSAIDVSNSVMVGPPYIVKSSSGMRNLDNLDTRILSLGKVQ